MGGTFTDVVVDSETGPVIGKALTDYGRIFNGIYSALGMVAQQLRTDPTSLLAGADLVIYSTTLATNAILEGGTARTALLVTRGFPDVLVLREGGKTNGYDFRHPFPDPYIPRSLTFEVDERLSSEGDVLIQLDENQVVEVLDLLKKRSVAAIAVCFLWSVVNPEHERTVGRLIAKHLPEVPFSLSHEVNPIIREYRRASATAIDASLKPLMQEHVRGMEHDLRSAAFDGELLVAISAGGLMHAEDVIQKPLYMVRSGPSLAPTSGKYYAELETCARDVVVCDTGGTSFDVSLIRDGTVTFTRETWLGPRFSGHLTGLSSVDVRSIGAGGGSLAWIDSGGLLHVGPQSAGVEPGPACYGRGGREPTLTDAALVLGYLDAYSFLGGRMTLDVDAAFRSMARLSSHLSCSARETAAAIVSLSTEQMVRAIEEITIREGVDPRESLLVAGGGAAGLTIASIAAELGAPEVLVPRSASALSAWGGQCSDVVADFTVSRFAHTADFPFLEINQALQDLEAQAEVFADGLKARGYSESSMSYRVEARYPHQIWELDVPVVKRLHEELTPADLDLLVAGFHQAHHRVFASSRPGQPIECLLWKLRLTVPMTKPLAPIIELGACRIPSGSREAYFPGLGSVCTPVRQGPSLRPNEVVMGPAIIEEPTTTIVVYPGGSARVTKAGNYSLKPSGPQPTQSSVDRTDNILDLHGL